MIRFIVLLLILLAFLTGLLRDYSTLGLVTVLAWTTKGPGFESWFGHLCRVGMP